jgi:hypothetical protein
MLLLLSVQLRRPPQQTPLLRRVLSPRVPPAALPTWQWMFQQFDRSSVRIIRGQA